MAADDKFYIKRGADDEMKPAITRPRETVVIRGPRQFGKTSLLTRYVTLCRENGKAVATINFAVFEQHVISDYHCFLTALAWQLAHCFRLRLDPAEGKTNTQQQFNAFLERTLLPMLETPVVFAFDATDRIMPQGFAEDFFSMVRMWHDDSSYRNSQWHKVGLALVSSSEPGLFIKDARRSPFNVGLRIRIEPFTAKEAAELNLRYGAPLSDADCSKLHRLVGGHPFLIQDAYYRLSGPNPIPFKKLKMEAVRDTGPFGDHLRAMRANVKSANLLGVLEQAIQHGTIADVDDFYRLECAGLVRRGNGRIVPTNQIYADFGLSKRICG